MLRLERVGRKTARCMALILLAAAILWALG
jgi:hypothetical protein